MNLSMINKNVILQWKNACVKLLKETFNIIKRAPFQNISQLPYCPLSQHKAHAHFQSVHHRGSI